MPGSSTTPGRPSACVGALGHIAFRYTDSVGTRDPFSIAAQWLACTFPCRRFADILAVACARLGADVVRYTFIVVDLHHLLLAGLPAHLWANAATSVRSGDYFSFPCEPPRGAFGFPKIGLAPAPKICPKTVFETNRLIYFTFFEAIEIWFN